MDKTTRALVKQLKAEIGLPAQVNTNLKALVKAQEAVMKARTSGVYEGEKLSFLRKLSMDLRDREYRLRRKQYEKECAVYTA